MNKQPTKLSKIFGSGPAGLLISLVLFCIANWLNKRIDLPSISNSRFLLNSVFFVSILTTLVIIVWGVRSLPTADRGNKLCTTGAYKYVRHPLYAAFLSIFDFGLAIYLNSYIFVLWAVLLHPIWHYVIKYEERLMIDIFGEEYLEYQKKTGRFLPKLKKS
ncbi:MAG: isoprenylcysteine carboxylmethyltransferase family protein [Candidatus Omnitrophota bacterium]